MSKKTTSPNADDPYEEPSRIVHGVTKDMLDSNPTLAEFYRTNFPPEEYQRIVSDGPVEGDTFSTLSAVERRKKKNKSSTSGMDDDEETSSSSKSQNVWISDRTANEFNVRKMYCYTRDVETEEGSNQCRKLRQNAFIPGVIYGGDPTKGIVFGGGKTREEKNRLNVFVKTPWSVIHSETARYRSFFENRVYDLKVYNNVGDEQLDTLLSSEDNDGEDEMLGEIIRVIPRDYQLHPVKNYPYCLNYIRYYPGRTIKIPIGHVNLEESPALKRGGFMIPITRTLECIVEDGVPIPETLDLDLTGAVHKSTLRLDRVNLPDGVKVSKNVNQREWLHGTIVGKWLGPVAGEEGGEDGDGDE